MTLRSINPATKEVIFEAQELTAQELESKLSQAQLAFEAWRQTSIKERAVLVNKLADYLIANKVELGAIVAKEVGKTLAEAEAEVEKSAQGCQYYANNASKFLSAENVDTGAKKSYVRFDPIGIVLAVMPWNFPFWMALRSAAPALMAGNVFVLKHASSVQMSAQAIERAFHQVGFPQGVFYNLAVGSSRVNDLIRDPRVRGVTLTGSESTGSQVAKIAGEEIKKTVLELGGSDPFIVLSDADPVAAAELAVRARLRNTGQGCNTAKRFIVHKSLVDTFVLRAKSLLEKLVVGDPMDPKTDVGPLANEKSLSTIDRQVVESVSRGARVVVGGSRGSDKGYFYLPTLLADVIPDMPVWCEETFGPIMPVVSFDNDIEAVRLANDSRYGLGATIVSADTDKAEALAVKIDSGCVYINEQVKSDPRMPFGGVKKSGYGRELSEYGIKEFVNIKSILVK